jgi:DNA repair exonuclease SbcCD nuclease subunit
MRKLIIGDMHLDAKVGKKYSFDYFYKIQDKIISLSNKSDMTIILGDIFKDPHPDNPYRKIFSEFLSKLKNAFVIIGNHDKDITGNSLQMLEPMSKKINFTIVDDFLEIDDCCLIAYHRNSEDTKEIIKNTKKEVIIGHFDIGHYELNGKIFESEIEEKLSKEKQFYLGHIHKRQEFKTVKYVGSVVPTNLSELDYKFGIMILNDSEEKFIDFNDVFNVKKIKVNNLKDLENIKQDDNICFEINIKDIKEKFIYMEKIKEYLAVNFIIEKQNIDKKKIDFNLNLKIIVDEYLKMIGKEDLKSKINRYLEGI